MKNRLIFLSFLFYLGCENTDAVLNNPLDEEGEGYTSPTVSLLDIANGDTLFSESVIFNWEGNELVSDFRYKLDFFEWTSWNENSFAEISFLDEGVHQLSVQSRYLNGDTSEIERISFIIDAVEGPSLMLYPRRHITKGNEVVTFLILAEEVTDLMLTEIYFNYDPSAIDIVSAIKGEYLQNSENSIFLCDIDEVQGRIQINTTLLDVNVTNIVSTVSLVEIQVRLIQGNSSAISFDPNNVLIDVQDNQLIISETTNGVITN